MEKKLLACFFFLPGCEQFTDLLSFPVVGDIQMIQMWLNSGCSLSSVTAPGNWGRSAAGRFTGYNPGRLSDDDVFSG